MNSFPPIPASPFFIDHLLGLVFVIHLIFMNYIVAAPVIATWYLWALHGGGRTYAQWLMAAVPVAFTFTINFGVAALLFVQVLYPERFYTANIILGKAWLGIVGLLMLAFYLCYLMLRMLERKNRSLLWPGASGVAITGLIWMIAALMIGNYFIATEQAQWPQLLHSPWLVVQNLTFVPRILHFITGSFAVTGLWMVWIASWRLGRSGPVDRLTSFRRHGLYIAAGATGLQIIIGVWFLLWLSAESWDRLFSGSFPSIVWIIGVASGLILLGLLLLAIGNPESRRWRLLSTLCLFITLSGMSAGRDVVRHAAFGGNFHIRSLPSQPQTQPITMFLILFLAGIGTVLWLVWMIRRSKPPESGGD